MQRGVPRRFNWPPWGRGVTGASARNPRLDRAQHADHRVPTHGWQEARKLKPLLTDRDRGLKGEPEERKLFQRIRLPPIAVLAIHDLRFLRMYLQFAVRQTLIDLG